MKIQIISKQNCSECERIKTLMNGMNMDYVEQKMEELDISKQFELRNTARKNRQAAMPLIFVDEEFVRTSVFETTYLKGGIA